MLVAASVATAARIRGTRGPDKLQTVNGVRDNWLHIQEQADKENGHAGVYWDPMAPKVTPTAG